MARTELPQIDALLGGLTQHPLGPADCLPDTVGFVQDLLIGHDFKRLPGPLGNGRNTFGPRTLEALSDFQKANGLPSTGMVDQPTLQRLIQPGWPRPIACCGYLALVLDVAFAGMVRLVSVTSMFEGEGLFAAMNRNTDRAGLSFGLIQWAQKAGRLHELLRAFYLREPQLFVTVFGDGDAALAQGLLAHTAKPRGGTDVSGCTTDPRFNLTREPWDQRFVTAGHAIPFQRVQIDVAIDDFTRSFLRLHTAAPQIRSERGIAFILDVANQHGDAGARAIISTVQRPGASEADLIDAIERESLVRIRAIFGEGPQLAAMEKRRQAFRTTALLSGSVAAIQSELEPTLTAGRSTSPDTSSAELPPASRIRQRSMLWIA